MDAQSKREFVGLTDDEIAELHHNWITNSDTMYFARAIEQALKEKNNVGSSR